MALLWKNKRLRLWKSKNYLTLLVFSNIIWIYEKKCSTPEGEKNTTKSALPWNRKIKWFRLSDLSVYCISASSQQSECIEYKAGRGGGGNDL